MTAKCGDLPYLLFKIRLNQIWYSLEQNSDLYVSFDNAKTWNQWRHGYPNAVSTYDMVIQEREADLVIGTFGRSIYVLDDIRPLRIFAKNQGKHLPVKSQPFLL
jgi:hypothetical protein